MRINPNEIHIHDPEWLDVLYTRVPKVDLRPGLSAFLMVTDSSQSVRDKYDPTARMTGMPKSSSYNLSTSKALTDNECLVFSTVSHDLHRKRRAAINPLFSRGAVKASEMMIYEQADILCKSLGKQLDQNGKAEMRLNFTAWATDVISIFALPKPLHLLEDPQASAKYHLTTKVAMLLTPLQKPFPWLVETALRLPLAFVQLVSPNLARSVALYRVNPKAFLLLRNSRGQCSVVDAD